MFLVIIVTIYSCGLFSSLDKKKGKSSFNQTFVMNFINNESLNQKIHLSDSVILSDKIPTYDHCYERIVSLKRQFIEETNTTNHISKELKKVVFSSNTYKDTVYVKIYSLREEIPNKFKDSKYNYPESEGFFTSPYSYYRFIFTNPNKIEICRAVIYWGG